MKFGAHSYVFTDRWSDDSLPILDTTAELGLECFEIGVGDDVPFSPDLTRRKAEKLGLDLLISPGGTWPLECDLSAPDVSDRKAGLAWHKKQADLACELGAVAYCGSIYGHTGVVRRGRPPADEYPRTAEGLHQLADYACGKGVAIVLEPMSHFRTHVVNKPGQLVELMALADHSNLYALLDTYHMVTELRDYADAVRTLRDSLYAVHACESDRGAPGGGLVPWQDLFFALVETGFSGYITMESYVSSLGDFAHERGMFHDVCPEPAAFVQKGLAFLKEGVARAANSSAGTREGTE